MFEALFNTEEHCVKKFYLWHRTFYRWMNSISQCSIEKLKKELDAIEWEKTQDTDSKYYIYKTELLDAQGAIVKRIIEENQKNKLDLTYAELEALVGISITVDGGDDLEFMKNCRSGAMKLKTLMEKMKEEKELK